MSLTVLEIVKKYLIENGLDGLFNPNDECCCDLPILCDRWEAAFDIACTAGYKHFLTQEEKDDCEEDVEWTIRENPPCHPRQDEAGIINHES